MSEDDKKEGLLKRLKNIEGKNEVQLQAIKDQGEVQLREIKDINKSNTLKVIGEIGKKNANANKILLGIKEIDETLDNAELVCTKTDGTKYDFNHFLSPLKFVAKIHNYEITLDEAINDQTKLGILINKLNNNYNPRIPEKVKEKNNVLKSAKKLFSAREEIINLFEKGIFPYKGNLFKSKEEEESKEEEKRVKTFIKYIENESKGINYDLFWKYFNFAVITSGLTKQLYGIKNRKENNELVNVIKSELSDLKDEIKETSEDEKNPEKPDKILKIVEEILDFINKQNQIGKGLKILTPSQMLSRLPISLAQLKAGNNSENLKNEIRQLLYSLYRSKKLTKEIYKSLIDII